jgi:ribosome biogenesis GTPase
MRLEDLGWNEQFAAAFAAHGGEGLVPARLARETKINYTAILGDGDEREVVVSGKVWHDAVTDADLPAVGDWVALDVESGSEPVIRAVLPRRTRFSRKAPGNSAEEQVIACNVDTVVVVTDPGEDFNVRRLERFHTLIRKSGAVPVVLINKSDLHDDIRLAECAEAAESLGDEIRVHVVSALTDEGVAVLRDYLGENHTLALCGSSGVGKSTLVNRLLGEDYQWTFEVNEVTGKGRHTTVARELVMVPGGGMLIDNPGVREIQMWTDEQTLREAFADIEELAADCRFRDCRHRSDAGCAIRAAYQAGVFDKGRYRSFLNLGREIEELKRRCKKRQVAVERWAKRTHRVKARNLADRIEEDQDYR